MEEVGEDGEREFAGQVEYCVCSRNEKGVNFGFAWNPGNSEMLSACCLGKLVVLLYLCRKNKTKERATDWDAGKT